MNYIFMNGCELGSGDFALFSAIPLKNLGLLLKLLEKCNHKEKKLATFILSPIKLIEDEGR